MNFVYSIKGSLCGYFRGPTTSTLRRAKNWELMAMEQPTSGHILNHENF
jgi:hypothetical protein